MSAFLFPIIFVLASLGLFFGYTSSAYDNIDILTQDVVRLDNALKSAKELTRLRDGLVARFNTISEADMTRLEKLLPDNIDNIRLIMDIDNIAAARGVNIAEFTFAEGSNSKQTQGASPTSAPGGTPGQNSDMSSDTGEVAILDRQAALVPYGSMELSFKADGSYEDFLAFLTDLEKSLRVVNIKKIELEAAEADSYSYSIVIETYWLK